MVSWLAPMMPTAAALSLLFLIAASPFGRPAPELRALFAPADAEPVRYEAFVSDESVDALAPRMRTPGVAWPEGAWTVERQQPLDAFGADGRYDRYRLARVFGGTRPRVARGPVLDPRSGRAIGSVTMISPYPNPALTSLVPGTLTILVYLVPPHWRMPTVIGLDWRLWR